MSRNSSEMRCRKWLQSGQSYGEKQGTQKATKGASNFLVGDTYRGGPQSTVTDWIAFLRSYVAVCGLGRPITRGAFG